MKASSHLPASAGADREILGRIAGMLESGALSQKHGGGPFVRAFESRFAAMAGAGHAVCVNSGTAALHVALAGLGVGPGDEVIVDPMLRFAAAAVIQAGAVPVFADLDPQSWLMSPGSAAQVAGPRTRAVVATAFFGLPVDAPALAAAVGAPLVEDAAQALLAQRDGRRVGTGVAAGTFSFQASKHLSTGEGGMLITDDEAVALRALELREHGWRPGRRGEDCVRGWMYRMPEPCAAIGEARLQDAMAVVQAHGALARLLSRAVEDIAWITPQVVPVETRHAYWAWGARVEDPVRLARLIAAVRLDEHGLEAGFCCPGPVYLRRFLQDYAAGTPPPQPYHPGLCPVAEQLAPRILHSRIDPRRGAGHYERLAEDLRRAARTC